MRELRRWMAWLAGLWAGALVGIAAVAAPAAFAVLPRADAGRVVGRIFAQEAVASLVVGALLVLAARRRGRAAGDRVLAADALLALLAIFCTVAGYYAIAPMMEQARAGQGAWSAGALHAVSVAFYAVKTVAVAALAWWLAGAPPRPPG